MVSFQDIVLSLTSTIAFIFGGGVILKNAKERKISKYSKLLTSTLIKQNVNPVFYTGNVEKGAKLLTKKVADTLKTDRCSIWLYNTDKTSIICDKLYVKNEDKWYGDIELLKEDFKPYFESLEENPIIIANDAENHPATSCFKEKYLRPLGIKSMLDVPVSYQGDIIGVICIESFKEKNWTDEEVNFARLISSLYTFSYSVNETNKISNLLKDFEYFVDTSVLISKADKNGKITYVNEKFTEVSGYSLKEVLGKDHKILNSGQHPKEMWEEMYFRTIKEKKIWNQVVTNKTKNGELYWVDSYIKANFDEQGNHIGYISIRYDVSDIIKKTYEIEKKNTYLEHAAKILRHDMHSGINTYIPRGVSSLERRVKPEDIEVLKLTAPLKMIKDGLRHSQKVYKGVYEFTNLVKKDAVLDRKDYDLKEILNDYLSSTPYHSQVLIDDLPILSVNEALFCTAVDNLIRNGLKYNDSDTKVVKIYSDKEYIYIQDNGRGITQEEFLKLSKPYVRKEGQKESGSGLGLNISVAIFEEHGFELSCEKNEIGTKMKIKIQ